jgi:hypothetical protein
MIYFEYHKKLKLILDQAKEKYPFLFDQWLTEESTEVRFYLYEYLFREFRYLWKLAKDAQGKPIPIDIDWKPYYWSISHSYHYVSFIVSDNPTGIDIAECHERDISLLDIHHACEYDLFWEKNWKNFYILWTAKEAIIKLTWWKLDHLEDIHLSRIEENWTSLFEFSWQVHTIKTIIDNSVIISYIS